MSTLQAIHVARQPVMERHSLRSVQAAGPSFADALDAAADRGTRSEKARLAAEKLVASALLEPTLASMRDSPFLEGPFAPGPAEKRFGPLLDAVIAERITSASSFSLIDAIVERYGGLVDEPSAAGAFDAAIMSEEARYGGY